MNRRVLLTGPHGYCRSGHGSAAETPSIHLSGRRAGICANRASSGLVLGRTRLSSTRSRPDGGARHLRRHRVLGAAGERVDDGDGGCRCCARLWSVASHSPVANVVKRHLRSRASDRDSHGLWTSRLHRTGRHHECVCRRCHRVLAGCGGRPLGASANERSGSTGEEASVVVRVSSPSPVPARRGVAPHCLTRRRGPFRTFAGHRDKLPLQARSGLSPGTAACWLRAAAMQLPTCPVAAPHGPSDAGARRRRSALRPRACRGRARA